MKAFFSAVALLAIAPILAQTPTKPKTPPSKKKTPPTIGVKGANQMTGGAIRFGELFGLKTGFTYQILSARFSLDPFDDYNKEILSESEKFILLTVAIKNNKTQDNWFGTDDHAFQVVDSENQLINDTRYRLKSKPGLAFSPTLKPGQGLGQNDTSTVEVAIKMPLKARPVKLILKQPREGVNEEVLRFFLAGATEAEAGGKPDPKNVIAPLPSWAQADTVVPSDAFYPSRNFYFRLDKFSSATKIDAQEAEEGKKWVFAHLTIRNALSIKQSVYEFFRGDDIREMYFKDADGEKYPANRPLKAKTDESPNNDMEPNEERAMRVAFQVPNNASFKTIRLGAPGGHLYLFDASAAGK